MTTIKRRVANGIERFLGGRVVRPRDLPLLYEQDFLATFFAAFEVDAVFDVGANTGQYAQMLRQRVGFTGPIVSFEPIPEVAASLRACAAADPLWHIEEIALDRTDGEAIFNVMASSEFSSLHSPAKWQPTTLAHLNHVGRSIPVKLKRLDGLFDAYADRLGFKNPFLKMDTQGNDVAVVEGAGDRLRRFVGLQSELAIVPLYEGSPRFTEAIAAYEACGFRMSGMFPNNVGHFPWMLEMDCVMFREGAG